MALDAAPLVWRAISLLHANGQTTHRVLADSEQLARSFGLELKALPQWDGIFCRTRPINEPNSQWHEEFLPVRPAGVDMNKVAKTNALINRVSTDPKPLSPEKLARIGNELDAIAKLKPSSNTRFTVMASFGASALGVIFGVSDPVVLGLIFLTAALGAMARRWLSSVSDNLLLQPFVAALIAGLMGGYAQHLFKDGGLQFVEIAPCMILVPGAHILNASLDLIRGRLGLGVARSMYCLLILLAICAGLLTGLTATNASLAAGMATSGTPLWLDIISAGIAVAAFGAFFSLPWSLLWAPVIVGMIGHGSRWLLLDHGAGVATATLVACLIAGVAMTLLSRRLQLPFAALAFASVVSMMPGIFVFKFANGLMGIYLGGDAAPLSMMTAAVGHGTAALLIVLVMTFGLIMPKMLIEGVLIRDR